MLRRSRFVRLFMPVAFFSMLAACSSSGSEIASLPQSGSQAASQNQTIRAALISQGGSMHSFSDAVGHDLRSDADYEGFIDPQITGSDRTLALKLLKLMPPNKRGDFTYIGADGHIVSNRVSVRDSVESKSAMSVKTQMAPDAARAGSSHVLPNAYPPTGGSGGAYIRNYSSAGVTAAYGYATVPCEASIATGDAGDMYFNNYSAVSSGSVVDGGLEMHADKVVHPFLNVHGTGYVYHGWTNNSQTYSCGTGPDGTAQQAIGIMFGTLGASDTIMLAVGIPTYSPYQYQLPPDVAYWHKAAWIFYGPANGQAPPIELFSSPGSWNGIPSPCMGCSVARMFTIAQTFPNSPSLDCFGNCSSGKTTGRWDQNVMGELIQPCSEVPNQSFRCTIEFTTNGSWYGNENDSGKGIYFNEPNVNHGWEAINLQYAGRNTQSVGVGSFGPLQPVPTPGPCGANTVGVGVPHTHCVPYGQTVQGIPTLWSVCAVYTTVTWRNDAGKSGQVTSPNQNSVCESVTQYGGNSYTVSAGSWQGY